MDIDYSHADPKWLKHWQSLEPSQREAIENVIDEFDGDVHAVCEAMGMEWDGNMGWNT